MYPQFTPPPPGSRMGTKSSPPPSSSSPSPSHPSPFSNQFPRSVGEQSLPRVPRRPTSLALGGPRPSSPPQARNARLESMIGATRAGLGGFPFTNKLRCHYFGSIAFNTAREVFQRTECGSAADLFRIRKLFPLFLHLLRFFPDLIQTMIQTYIWSSIPTMGFTVLLDSQLNPPCTCYCIDVSWKV